MTFDTMDLVFLLGLLVLLALFWLVVVRKWLKEDNEGDSSAKDGSGSATATVVAGPLTIELVPSTCWFSNVRTNVSKEEWDRLRKATYREAKHHCEICGGQGPKWPVECHEIWHYDDKIRRQTLTGLIALCPACHEVKHIGLAGLKGRHDVAAAHLAKVNTWTMAQAKAYIEEQFAVWERRSRHEWQLDISWLRSRGVEAVVSDRQQARHEEDWAGN